MNLKDLFISNLKKYRKIQGISQMRLAHLCNSATSYIGQIEIGNKFPSIDMIDKMSKALNIKPYMFFLDETDADSPLAPRPSKRYVMPETNKDELIQQLTTAIRRIVKKQ